VLERDELIESEFITSLTVTNLLALRTAIWNQHVNAAECLEIPYRNDS
jgi:hypothetical protein